MRPASRAPLLLAVFLSLPATIQAADSADCAACGLRKPGARPRELAILAVDMAPPYALPVAGTPLAPLQPDCDTPAGRLAPLCALEEASSARQPASPAKGGMP